MTRQAPIEVSEKPLGYVLVVCRDGRSRRQEGLPKERVVFWAASAGWIREPANHTNEQLKVGEGSSGLAGVLRRLYS